MSENYADNLSKKQDKDCRHLTANDIVPVKIELRTDIPIVHVANKPYLVLHIVFDYRLINDFLPMIQFPLPYIHKLTAFEFDGNLYHWNVLPNGIEITTCYSSTYNE